MGAADPAEYPFVPQMATQLAGHDDRVQFLVGIDVSLASCGARVNGSDQCQWSRSSPVEGTASLLKELFDSGGRRKGGVSGDPSVPASTLPAGGSQARNGSRCDSGADTAGLCWTHQDLFLAPPRADLGHSEFTDAGRTERRFHAA